mmetsp:Transcript_68412/g.61477  ORF Transcript_68412/g.61477 Transcript_68412/m.61477 type:complete len:218 (+) Transcript_68412:34-687(+)
MGACLSLCDEGNNNNRKEDVEDNNAPVKKPLTAQAVVQEEKQIIEVKIDNIDPWKYSESLSINDVTELLKDMAFDDCDPFVAPIKYGKVVKVYDGDTIHMVAPLFDGVISRFRVRLNGIDTPELRTKDEWEKKAGYIVKDMLIEKIGDKIIELKDVSYDKYGRILAEIIFEGENINQWLIETEWAFPYQGKGEKLVKKADWKSKVMQFESENIEHEA